MAGQNDNHNLLCLAQAGLLEGWALSTLPRMREPQHGLLLIDGLLRDWGVRQLVKGFETNDVDEIFLSIGNSAACMEFVLDNILRLSKKGILEASFVHAWTMTKGNHHHRSASFLESILYVLADRKKLLAAGEPLPDGQVFTVYRGVAGKGPYRRVRGLAWTASLEIASWFALRYYPHLPDPAVYRAKVRMSDVLWYESRENEFVCRPKSYRRIPMDLCKMKRLKKRYIRRRAKEMNELLNVNNTKNVEKE